MDIYLVDCENGANDDSAVGTQGLRYHNECLIRESARKAAESGVLIEKIWHVDTIPAEQSARIFARHLDSPSGEVRIEKLGSENAIETQLDAVDPESGPIMLIADGVLLHRLVGQLVADDPGMDLVTFADKQVVHLNRSGRNWTIVAGGDNKARRISLKEWLRDFSDSILSVDGRFRITLRTLFLEPGRLSVEWIAGNRALYASPMRIYVVCSTIFFGVQLLMWEFQRSSPLVLSDYDTAAIDGDSLIAYLGFHLSYLNIFQKFETEFWRSIRYTAIIMVPGYALILLLIFQKKPYFYLEHLVFAVHLMSFGFLLSLLQLVIVVMSESLVPQQHRLWIDGVTAAFILFIFLVYSVKATCVFYDEKWKVATAKAVIAFLGYILLLLIPTALAAVITIATDRDVDHAHQPYWQVIEGWHDGESIDELDIHGAIGNYLKLDAVSYSRPHTQLHVAELLIVAGYFEEARNKAEGVLLGQPEDAFALAVAAGASCKLEDREGTFELVQRHHAVREARLAEEDPLNHGRHAPLVERYLACAEGLSPALHQ